MKKKKDKIVFVLDESKMPQAIYKKKKDRLQPKTKTPSRAGRKQGNG